VECQLNGFENNIQVVEACAGEVIGEVELLSSGVFSDGYFRMTSGRSSRELTKTKAVTIDRLAEQLGAPTHIKIDVEDMKQRSSVAQKKTITNLSPLLFLELHNEMIRADGGDPARVLDDLAEMKYEELSINGVNADRDRILRMPICRLVARRSGTS
jgi:hypothetical protein